MLAHPRRHPPQGAYRPLRVMTRLGKVAVAIIKQSDHCVRISPAGCIVHGFLACSTVIVIGTRQEEERNGWTRCMLVSNSLVVAEARAATLVQLSCETSVV
ncbi:hypothetical protein BO86DRAFT_103732 [Aspergillus japonicus CBS 114.51]|uniref:Uncharacterized protein n=1 Tax=Aspergillus japonicus CBS 114.51 TaxID=1448312 RepID=A0A8T8WZE1_ASPJA|nr:hypothetical protein BO86DRAFT_103732 [Aspergillus japonicus CBS 114.51]RAH81266.1 hypothetical protein BO86DRAFT_103732 [Aspergillus japonicus CBS 114.51]